MWQKSAPRALIYADRRPRLAAYFIKNNTEDLFLLKHVLRSARKHYVFNRQRGGIGDPIKTSCI